jgi:hypothetical protein
VATTYAPAASASWTAYPPTAPPAPLMRRRSPPLAIERIALDDEQRRGFALGVNLIPQQALFRAVVNSPTNSAAGVYCYGRSTPIPSGDKLNLNYVTIIAQAADGAYPESDRAIPAFETALLAHDLYGTYQAKNKSPAALAAMIGVLPNLYV